MIVVKHKGDLSKTTKYLQRMSKFDCKKILERYAQEGVKALETATPVDTGLTAKSWGYEISIAKGSYSITFTNSNVIDGVPIAIILQYGHGTRNGGWVKGVDYINPSLQPIFDKIANDAWREVTKR